MRFWLALAAVVALGGGALASQYEVGYQLDVTGGATAPYVYATEDFSLGHVGPIDLWFSPSAELVFSAPLSGFVETQFLLDTAPATLSLRGTYEFGAESRLVLRAGILFGQ